MFQEQNADYALLARQLILICVKINNAGKHPPSRGYGAAGEKRESGKDLQILNL